MTDILKFSYYNFFIPVEERRVYLLYNSLNNSLIELDWELGELTSNMNSEEIHFLPIHVKEALKNNGNIIQENVDEFSVIRHRAKNQRELFKDDTDIKIVIAPTNSCNMRCIYCFEGEKTHDKVLDLFRLKNTVHQIINAKNIKSVSILWFGGEPLLKAHLIDEVSEYVRILCDKKDLKYRASIITNGSLLTEGIWNMLNRNKIFSVQVTLDGASYIHNKKRVLPGGNSFDIILKNLCLMPESDFKIVVRVNGDKEVFKSLHDFFNELYEKKLWPHKYKNIKIDWAMKFYDIYGDSEKKDLYLTSYEYQKTKTEFVKLQHHYLNIYCKEEKISEKQIKIMYPKLAQFYCAGIECYKYAVIDGNGNCYKCYNSVGREADKISSIEDFDINENMDSSLCDFDRTLFSDCQLCKILPICHEHCNYRLTKRNQSMVCCEWRFFMNERMKGFYLQSKK